MKYFKNDIYVKALQTWGEQSQKAMAIEECSELITKLIKEGRNVNGSSEHEIVEEIADVIIMMEQLQKIYGKKEVTDAKTKKLKRLGKRLGISPWSKM